MYCVAPYIITPSYRTSIDTVPSATSLNISLEKDPSELEVR